MRIPGFLHQKQPRHPFLVRLFAPEPFPAFADRRFQDELAAAEARLLIPREMARGRSLADVVAARMPSPPDMTKGYPDGQRTRELTRRAGWCLGPAKMSEPDATNACLDWNLFNDPPLSEEKIRSTVTSIARCEARKLDSDLQPAQEPQATYIRLVTLSPFDYDRARLKEAERLGIRLGTLDDEVAALRPDEMTSQSAGRPLTLPSPEPWPDPVSGVDLLNEIARAIHRYVVLPREAIVASMLFVAYAHAFEAWSISPRLAITSPEMQCGKTTLLSVLEPMVPRALKVDNVTPAAVFRVVELARPTLLIDEADAFIKNNEEWRGGLK